MAPPTPLQAWLHWQHKEVEEAKGDHQQKLAYCGSVADLRAALFWLSYPLTLLLDLLWQLLNFPVEGRSATAFAAWYMGEFDFGLFW